ncbi:sulfite exporter TauE/SafE family protein [Microvirga sp. ACRRW]|uniref:sulfite exporter TauE/SafE family protein n=1 Tax=Microvirga sp. ACRRW TaxID=2918205 RepID=UPI001EF57BEE|nr:sulfite exporter TauE/SafE family protein [Microvirga sp. ACRRW]MCG7393373.1 sulfite exporter TauE/SafE family protein [Microvirga sp. ACRRW]
MTMLLANIASIGSGALVGLVLGLVGGGGSIIAVPLLVYAVGIASPHVAIGTGALAVSASAFGNMIAHWRAGNVKWRCALVFASAGVVGALAGSTVAKAIDGQKLLALFGLLMIIVGFLMLRRKSGSGDPSVRLTRTNARMMLPALLGSGFAVGLLSGFFGIGGGFLIVPGLMLSTGMPLSFAIGSSLVAVTAFGAATATSYAFSGLVDWAVATLFIGGGILGGMGGLVLGRLLSNRKQALGTVFAVFVIAVGGYIILRGMTSLASAATLN